jgi:hypothetical protein
MIFAPQKADIGSKIVRVTYTVVILVALPARLLSWERPFNRNAQLDQVALSRAAIPAEPLYRSSF